MATKPQLKALAKTQAGETRLSSFVFQLSCSSRRASTSREDTGTEFIIQLPVA